MRSKSSRVFLFDAMTNQPRLLMIHFALFAAVLALQGCFLDYWAYHSAGGGNDATLGEEHAVNFPQSDAIEITQDALRGQGILFERQPNDEIITLWRDTDIPQNIFASLVKIKPRYRYEIQIVPVNDRQSKVIINLRTDNIPDDQVADYKASARFHLFDDIDKLAKSYSAPSATPKSGGVNYALLPGEDLKALAKRVTSNADNWQEIAKLNGIKSPGDLGGVETIWVPNTMLKKTPATPSANPRAETP